MEHLSPSPAFDVAMVRNTGSAQRTWAYMVGATTSQINERAFSQNMRLMDVEPYPDSATNGYRLAAILLSNSGGDQVGGWTWWVGPEPTELFTKIQVNSERVLRESWFGAGPTKVAALVGVKYPEATEWWSYWSVLPSELANFIAQGRRIIDLNYNASSPSNPYTFDAEGALSGPPTSWLHGLSRAALEAELRTGTQRIFDVKSYPDAYGNRLYDALLVEDPLDTTIQAAPQASTTASQAAFGFSSTQPGSGFECSLDGSAFSPCTSPQAYLGLGVGAHQFKVRAVNSAGQVDSSPASYVWGVSAPPPPPAGPGQPGAPVHCVVPRLKGQTVATARRMLASAHCRLGATKRRSRRARRIVGQRPAARTTLAAGASVSVTLG